MFYGLVDINHGIWNLATKIKESFWRKNWLGCCDVLNMFYKNGSILEFLLIKTMFEETEHWRWNTVDVTVFTDCHHSINIHRFTGKELQVLKSAKHIFHIFVNVGFEDFNLIGAGFFQFGNQSVTFDTIKSQL